MEGLRKIASHSSHALVEMADALREVAQPEMARWAENIAARLHQAVYDSMGETSLALPVELVRERVGGDD